MTRGLIVAAGLLAAGVAASDPASAADPSNGWDSYGRVSAVSCAGRPVLLQASHTDITVTGPCRYVRVAGEHNDIHTDVLAGGTVEITGAHNDVWWRQLSRGPRPRLLDSGTRNTFHKAEEE